MRGVPPAAGGRDIDLLVVGEINPDIVVWDADPTPVFGQVERFVEGVRLTVGSSCAITACGAARLGLAVSFVGVVGDDALGRFMLEAMADRGIDVSACRIAAGRPTGASVILGNAADRAILTSIGTIADVRAADVPPGVLTRTRHVHAGSYFLQPGLAVELPGLFRAARAAGATTSLDPNWDASGVWNGGFAAAAAEADVLLPNAGEVRRLTGIEDVTTAAIALSSMGGAGHRTVAVKRGVDGALAVGPDGTIATAGAIAVEAVDATGAGDSFNAGFLAAWLEGQPLEDALRLGVACGSLSTRSPGGTDGQPTRAEADAAVAAMDAA